MVFEEKLIYFPSSDLDDTPAALGLEHEDVVLHSSDGIRLHAWFLPARTGARRFTVLVCHGNAGNISHRLERALSMQRELGVDVLLFDYRGFGRSEGKPREQGTYEDALSAYRYLASERGIAPERIVLFGESLGAAVAVELSSRVPARALVLESPFTSIRAMARVAYPFLPAGWVRTKYDNLEKIGSLTVPLLVIHGTRDEVVPFRQGQELFRAAREPKRFLGVEGAGHTDSYVVGGASYWNAWRELLESVERR
jgi:fermentation-respiration switch protein FrsA (DUF1100 family)